MSPDAAAFATEARSDLNERTILDRIRAFVADAADCVLDQVGENDDIYEQLNVDSLGAVAIFIDVSYEFRVAEPATEEEYQSLKTPRKILEYILRAQDQREQTETPLPAIQPKISRDILAQLPYGEEFQFIDDVALHEKGHIITLRKWAAEDPIALAHFRKGPHLVPGVLLAEQVAQSALLLALIEGFVKDGERVLLSQLRCEFRAPVSVPAEVEADVRFRGDRLWTLRLHRHFAGVRNRSLKAQRACLEGEASVGIGLLMHQRPAIVGISATSALGQDWPSTWAALLQGTRSAEPFSAFGLPFPVQVPVAGITGLDRESTSRWFRCRVSTRANGTRPVAGK